VENREAKNSESHIDKPEFASTPVREGFESGEPIRVLIVNSKRVRFVFEHCLFLVISGFSLESISLVNYREHFDIIADILKVAGRNARKTQIMYQANLSYSILQRYLPELVAVSLVSFDDPSQSYTLTPKGQEFLNAYKEYSEARQHVEKRLNDIATKRRVLEQLCCASQTSV
jgi:predicted transcriptional regulator